MLIDLSPILGEYAATEIFSKAEEKFRKSFRRKPSTSMTHLRKLSPIMLPIDEISSILKATRGDQIPLSYLQSLPPSQRNRRAHVHIEHLRVNLSDNPILDEKGNTLLHLASYWGNLQLVEILVRRSVFLDPRNQIGQTPLHLSSSLNHHTEKTSRKITHLLLENGASPTATDEEDMTPLHYAATRSAEVIRLLLEKGAPLEAKNNKGETPLFLAASWGYSTLMEPLIRAGANLDTKNSGGWRTHDLAIMTRGVHADENLLALHLGGSENLEYRLEHKNLFKIALKANSAWMVQELFKRGDKPDDRLRQRLVEKFGRANIEKWRAYSS